MAFEYIYFCHIFNMPKKTNISSSSLAISKTFNWIHCDHIFRTFYGTIQFQIKAHGNFSNSFWQWKQFQTNEVKWKQKQGKIICIWQFNGMEIIRNVPSLLIQTPKYMLDAQIYIYILKNLNVCFCAKHFNTYLFHVGYIRWQNSNQQNQRNLSCLSMTESMLFLAFISITKANASRPVDSNSVFFLSCVSFYLLSWSKWILLVVHCHIF